MDNLIKRFHSNFYAVKNIDQTVQFYQKLNFQVEVKDETARVKLGDFTLAFKDESKVEIQPESSQSPKGVGIYTYVEVSDIDEYYKNVTSNVIAPESEPKTQPWGKREFTVKDPDGFQFVFFSIIIN